MFKTNDFNLKVLVRLSDEVYGFVSMWYKVLPGGEIVQFLNWIEFMHFHEWGCNISIDEHGKPGTLYGPKLNGVELDGRMKAYKQFRADAELQAQIREAAEQILAKAKTSFPAHRKGIADQIRKLREQIEELEWRMDVIDEYELLDTLRKITQDEDAPEGYFDLRVAELRETYAGSGNLGSLIWDDVKQDINDVKLRRTSWEQIMARLQPAEESEGG